jgi:sugar/nucleoside kinase (ribokinase family)
MSSTANDSNPVTPDSQSVSSWWRPSVGLTWQWQIGDNNIDTVGAGDSFDAGFMYGYLNDWALQKSLQLACICGALSTQQAVATDGQPTVGEALAFLR